MNVTITNAINTWSDPELKETNVFNDRIELIYVQTSMISYGHKSPEERCFKKVYSCIDGKWNESEPIYGQIIKPEHEQYIFE